MNIGRAFASGALAIGGAALSALWFGVDLIAEHPELVVLGASAGGVPWAGKAANAAAKQLQKLRRDRKP